MGFLHTRASVFEWFICGTSHKAAALIVGPALVATPCRIARTAAHRCACVRLFRPVLKPGIVTRTKKVQRKKYGYE